MQHRSTGALIGAALFSLAACGPGSDGAAPPVVEEQDAAAAAPVADGISDETDVASTQASADEQVTATNAPEQPASTGAPESESPAETAAPQAAAPAEPVVGGRLFAADVQSAAQFDGNPFPDLIVEDIGKNAQVNIQNILPSDRPVLLWAWAPH